MRGDVVDKTRFYSACDSHNRSNYSNRDEMVVEIVAADNNKNNVYFNSTFDGASEFTVVVPSRLLLCTSHIFIYFLFFFFVVFTSYIKFNHNWLVAQLL